LLEKLYYTEKGTIFFQESEIEQDLQNNISNVTSTSSISKKSSQPILLIIETKNQPSNNFIFPKHKKISFSAKLFEMFA